MRKAAKSILGIQPGYNTGTGPWTGRAEQGRFLVTRVRGGGLVARAGGGKVRVWG